VRKEESRAEAFIALYTADLMGGVPDSSELSGKAALLTNGVWEHRVDIDAVIGRISRAWRVERMPTIDRNLIRVGVYELLYTDEPVGIVVSQAVELAKHYSTAKSGAFVNGVLGRLVDELKAPSG
jgi:N utilization substance protein B